MLLCVIRLLILVVLQRLFIFLLLTLIKNCFPFFATLRGGSSSTSCSGPCSAAVTHAFLLPHADTSFSCRDRDLSLRRLLFSSWRALCSFSVLVAASSLAFFNFSMSCRFLSLSIFSDQVTSKTMFT